VIDNLKFTVEPGLITGFLGPNGSGKSTAMKVLLDLAAADPFGWPALKAPTGPLTKITTELIRPKGEVGA